MSQHPTSFPTKNENAEYLLGSLNDDSPASSASSVETVIENLSNALSSDKEESRRNGGECNKVFNSLCKYEKEYSNKIMTIETETEKIRQEIENLDRDALKAQFKRFEDILINKTIDLDKIDTKGLEKLREHRKAAINFVQECLKLLDTKTEGPTQDSNNIQKNNDKMTNGFKDLCATLLSCAEKFEQEMKINLNELHNLVDSGKITDIKMSLERAKDYHYKEIMQSIEEIFKHIKLILVHDEKIRYLNDEANDTKEKLKSCSNSQNSQSCMDLSNSYDDDRVFHNIKREKRRVASEISIGTLEAWEKYLDQKKDKVDLKQELDVKEVINIVPKRNNPDFRRRKKFVSSTLGGFLEDDPRCTQLNAIPEDANALEENEAFYSCEELNRSLPVINNTPDNSDDIEDKTDKPIAVVSCQHNNENGNEKCTRDKPRIVEVLYKKNPA